MARVSFEFKKGDFVWVSLIVVLLVSGFVVATWDSSKAMFHDSVDVKVTIDGKGDMSLQDAISGGFIGGGCKLGDWIDVSSVAAGGSEVASSDGFIVAYGSGAGTPGQLKGYSPATILRVQTGGTNTGDQDSFTMPVKNEDTWKVIGATKVYWVPLECSTAPVGGFTPAEYAGGESVTFPNGMIMKSGYKARSSQTMTIKFKEPFSMGAVSVQITPKHSTYIAEQLIVVTGLTNTGFIVQDNSAWAGNYADGFYWTVIGN